MLRDEMKWVKGIVDDSTHLLKNKLRKELASINVAEKLIERLDRVEQKLKKANDVLTKMKTELKDKTCECCDSHTDPVKKLKKTVKSVRGIKSAKK